MPTTESNSPALGHAPKPNNSRRRLSVAWILVAVVLGVLTGFLGTVLHLHSYWTGSFGIPWGVAVSLLIIGLAQRWIGLRTAHILAPGLTGIAQYATLAVLATFSRGDIFTVPLNAQTWEFVPHLVIATLIWHIGILVTTIVMIIATNRSIHRARAASTDQLAPTVRS